MNFIYGPVSSWRLGKSMGVDIINEKNAKVCSFDCVYCSLGETERKTVKRRKFVDKLQIEKELKKLPDEVEPDVFTISGTGEPTLSKNMVSIINLIKKYSSLPIAVITNSSLMDRKDVREDLSKADIVVGSLDSPNSKIFEKVNNPHPKINFKKTVEGMKKFSKNYEGFFSLETMFVQKNKNFSKKMAKIARKIEPDEVQINTPLRASPARSLNREEIQEVEKDFRNLEYRSVYNSETPQTKKIIGEEKLELLKRSGKNDNE